MNVMFHRSLGATGGLSRQSSSELAQTTSGAVSRGASRSNSFSRKVPSGALAGIRQSKSRLSLLVSCAGPNGFTGDSEPFSEAQAQTASNNRDSRSHAPQPDKNMRAQDAAAQSSPSSSHAAQPSIPPDPLAWEFSLEPFVPSPSNLPTNEDEPLLYPPRHLRPLRKDIWTLTDQPGVDLFLAGPKVWGRLRHIYVVLFGVGQRDTEGIYSLRAYGTDGTPHETIIAFECEEEAQRYATLLEASMEHTPHVCAIPPRELLSFCLDHCYSCRLEPRGSLLIPPDSNVSLTDWERSMRLRDGQFAVLDAEPELRAAAAGSAGVSGGSAAATVTAAPPAAELPLRGAAAAAPAPSSSAAAAAFPTLARYSGLSSSELAEVRARLESLLPAD